MLLAAVLTPAFAAQQLTESAPLLAQPILSFDGTLWHANSSDPAAYLVGLTKIAGMAEREAVVIVARPGVLHEGKGGAMQSLPADEWRGKRVRLTARLKSEAATQVQIVMDIVSGAAPERQTVQTMVTKPLFGTRDWHAQEIVMEVPADARDIVYGFYLRGRGMVFGDSFKLEAVGRNVALTRPPVAPAMVRSFSDVSQNSGRSGMLVFP